MTKKIIVIKASGKKEPFSEEKVRRSIKRAGIPPEIEDEVVARVREILYENIPTSKIYETILSFLKKSPYPHGQARYSLKQAIMSLGPSGYPFEKFVAAVLSSQDYETRTGVIIKGKCAKHEIDVLAQKGKTYLLVECKFHNRGGIKTDIKTALYVKARFDDLIDAWRQSTNQLAESAQVWLVTNTKFTRRVIRYGQCAGLKLLGWNYPSVGSLRDWVEKSGLHPITCLFSLSQNQKVRLLEKEIVLCRDLVKADRRLLHGLGLSANLVKKVIEEAAAVCKKA